MGVLVVEDNLISSRVIEQCLRKNGYEVTVANSGARALEYLENSPSVHAAVIDIMMPEMDGFELVAEIQKTPQFADLPIVMCSALSDSDTVERCMDMGCKHYVLKPISEEELIRKVRMALEGGIPTTEVRSETKRKLGIDDRTYDDTAHAFSKLCYETAGEIDLQLEEKGEAVIDFGAIVENISVFNATRLHLVLHKIVPADRSPTHLDRKVAKIVVHELRALQRALQPAQRTKAI